MHHPQIDGPKVAATVFDSHVHTVFCRHATGRLEEYVSEGFMRNLRGIVFTCHAPMPMDWAPNVRMGIEEYDAYLEALDELRAEWTGVLDVRRGLECDYVPGLDGYVASLLERSDLDYVLGSVHPQFSEYWERYYRNDEVDFQRTYFNHLAQAAESGCFDALAHPDFVREVFPDTWSQKRLWSEVLRALDRIAATGVAMEVNTASMHRVFRDLSPSREILAAMQERRIPVVLGSDAHSPGRVGDDFETALAVLEDAGFTQIHHYLGRQRRSIAIGEAKASLEAPATNRETATEDGGVQSQGGA